VFVHFCEAFLGILPSIFLFCYFFRLKPHPHSDSTSVLGGFGIQFCQNKQKEFFEYNLVNSVKDWRSEWFYARNMNTLSLSTQTLVLLWMTVGRSYPCRQKTSRRSSLSLSGSKSWSSKTWQTLVSWPVSSITECSLWRRGRGMVLSMLEQRTHLGWFLHMSWRRRSWDGFAKCWRMRVLLLSKSRSTPLRIHPLL
jgi:hypothetical protein